MYELASKKHIFLGEDPQSPLTVGEMDSLILQYPHINFIQGICAGMRWVIIGEMDPAIGEMVSRR